MVGRRLKIVHYVNQFFGGIGGEDKADLTPQVRSGAVGPGTVLQEIVKDWGDVQSTIVCGDNYFAEHMEKAAKEILDLLLPISPDIFIAGPAFNAGRYGIGCGELCKKIKERLGIAAVTGMSPEQVAVNAYKNEIFIVKTDGIARGMQEPMRKMARLALKLHNNETIGSPDEEGYIPRGVRKNILGDTYASERAIDMLLAKFRGLPFKSEIVLPRFDSVSRAEPVKDISRATITLVTTGGVVPKGNPDKLKSHVATSYGRYRIDGPDTLAHERYEANHGGYYTAYVNQNPNRMLPIDVLAEMEKEGRIGKLYPYFYTTAGTGTYPEVAEKMAREILAEIRNDGANGVIITST